MALFLPGVMLVRVISVIEAITITAAVADNNLFIGGDLNNADFDIFYVKAKYDSSS